MELRLFGAYLHGPIVIASNGPKEVPVMSPKELTELRSNSSGCRLLHALLYSMSTGHVDFNWEKSDVLLQNVQVKSGYFQLVMNVLLNKQKVTQNFMAALSAFSLAPSHFTTLSGRWRRCAFGLLARLR